MGVDFAYVNHDKREYFGAGLFAWNSRFSSLGRGPGARALGILLSHLGSWRGDRVSAVGDASDDYANVATTFDDVEIEAELMLIDLDGFEWVETRLQEDHFLFLRMCDYATYFRREDVNELLDETFGAGKWQRRYAEHCKRTSSDFWIQKVIDAANRPLKTLYVKRE